MLHRSLHKHITLQNVGNADLVVDDAVLHTGRSHDGASVGVFSKGGGWVEAPFVIREGEGMKLPFVFRPTIEQSYSTVFALTVRRTRGSPDLLERAVAPHHRRHGESGGRCVRRRLA